MVESQPGSGPTSQDQSQPPANGPRTFDSDDRPNIIHIKDLEKTYDLGTPLETRALRGVSFDITVGEIVIIFGPSGSGKSTLLNILAGLDEPTEGEAIINGKDLRRISAKERAQYHQYKVGMVFQSYNLVSTLTVIQNITMPARLAGFKKKDYIARGDDLLRQFKLEKLRDKLPSQCSGGQQQRVGIMRAFMNRPALIIADEPTGNLDSAASKQIMQLFKNLNKETNTSMIIVTHDPGLFAIADRVVHVLDGKVVKQTILTTKAKVDPKNAGVPIEYKYRTDDIDEYIKRMKGGEQEGIAGQEKKKEDALKERGEVIKQREEKIQLFWKQLRSLEEKIDKRAKELAKQRAFVARESEAITRERQHLLADEISLRQQQKDIREQSAVLQHVVKEELEAIEARAAEQKRKLEARRRLLEVRQAELDAAHKQLKEKQDGLAVLEKRKGEERAQEQARLDEHKEVLAQEQYQLETWRGQLEEWADTFEKSIEERLQQARVLINREREQRNKAMQRAKAFEERFQGQQAGLQDLRNKLQEERASLKAEQEQLTQQRKVIAQEAGTTREERILVQEMKSAFVSRRAWLKTEEKRLKEREDEMETQEEALKAQKIEHDKVRKQQEEQLRQRIAAAREMLEQAEYQMLTAKHANDSESLQKLERQYKEKIVALEKERQALLEERANLQSAMNKDAVQHRLTTAASIIDHEKEQMETENEKQLEDIKARQKLMAEKVAAARAMIEKESAVISREYKVLEQEKQLHALQVEQLEKEKKNIEKEWRKLGKRT